MINYKLSDNSVSLPQFQENQISITRAYTEYFDIGPEFTNLLHTFT